MDLLPISKIRDEDVPIFGANIINLARLSRAGLPVAEGVAVAAPEFKFRTILKHFNLKDREIFESSLTIIIQEVMKIPCPMELDQSIWKSLLEFWLSEIKTRIWREGLGDQTWNLTSQCVFFTKKINGSGRALAQNVEMESGKISQSLENQIKQAVKKADQLLFLPQVYQFIIEKNKFYLIKLTPHTPDPIKKEDDWLMDPVEKPKLKSSVRVFLDLSEGFELVENINGILIRAEELSGLSEIDKFEQLVFRLVEAGSTGPELQVIMKLSDLVESRDGVRGSLRLLHQKSLLKGEVEAFLFARRKKNLLNLSLAIPFTRSVNEFLEIKRELASLGVSRKGSLKLWLELCVPENILNLDEYVESGLDGVIINLDELSSFLGGFDHQTPESIFYKKQIKALIKLLEDGLKLLNKSKVPFLVSGELSLHDEVLHFLIDKGVYGIIANQTLANSLDQHLRFMETRVVRAKLV